MKIAVIPIDNRPVCYNLFKDIVAIDEDLELFIPPRTFLGSLTEDAKVEEIYLWLENLPRVDCMILALDTLAYGGLIPSRRGKLYNIDRLKPLLKNKKVYAFSSIMRISNNNCNDEEKFYWKDWGKKIFEYSFSGGIVNNGIPDDILEDYISTRKRNFEVNKKYIEWQKEGLFEELIFSKDDCAESGFNVDEAKELESLGGKTKTGADEIPLSLLASAIKKKIKVYPEFLEPEWKNSVSNYEDISIEKSVLGQLELGGFEIVSTEDDADLVLIINNFIKKQGELVMGWKTQGEYHGNFKLPNKPYCVADVRYANGADNSFVNDLLIKIDMKDFYGYAAWNTSANTLGSLLAGVKVKWQAKKYNDKAFKKLQMIRFLDDWAYQANVRNKINFPDEISELMKPYEEIIAEVLNYKILSNVNYKYPWNRKFEIEVVL